jgi:hypothetical protein
MKYLTLTLASTQRLGKVNRRAVSTAEGATITHLPEYQMWCVEIDAMTYLVPQSSVANVEVLCEGKEKPQEPANDEQATPLLAEPEDPVEAVFRRRRKKRQK